VDLRFATWNIHGRRKLTQRDLLKSVAPDLVCLQEVTLRAYQDFETSGLFDWSECSLKLRPTLAGESPARRLGCVIAGKACFRLKRAFLLEGVPLPESTHGRGRGSHRIALSQ
jgi:endonuclease/exonuclease/phosphatase family metal-dependent hydrolase